MVLYRSVEITCQRDIFDALVQASSGFPDYFEFVSPVIGAPNTDLREALSLRSLWTVSASGDDLIGCLVRLKLDWMEALYSALKITQTAAKSKHFHIIGHRLFPSALFFHNEHGEDTCIIAGATSAMLDRLTLCGVDVKRIESQQKENQPDSGIVVSVASRVSVQIAAAVIVDCVFSPFKTSKHCARVPTIVADFSFVNSTRRLLRLEDLCSNRRDDIGSAQRHRYRVSGYISEEAARWVSRIVSELLKSEDKQLVVRGPLKVPSHGIDSSARALMVPVVANNRDGAPSQSKSLKNPFKVVKSRPKATEELRHKNDSLEAAAAGDGAEGVTAIRCLVDEWSQLLSIADS